MSRRAARAPPPARDATPTPTAAKPTSRAKRGRAAAAAVADDTEDGTDESPTDAAAVAPKAQSKAKRQRVEPAVAACSPKEEEPAPSPAPEPAAAPTPAPAPPPAPAPGPKKKLKKRELEQLAVRRTLDPLTTALVGHLFVEATALSPKGTRRPALPLVSLHGVCDFLGARDLAVDLARTSRGAYATIADYGRAYQRRLKKQVEEDVEVRRHDPLAYAQQFKHTHRSMRLVSEGGVMAMCASRLCALVSDLTTPSLGIELLDAVVAAMPNLRALTLAFDENRVKTELRYPPGLHELNLRLAVDSDIKAAMAAVGQMKHLRVLSIARDVDASLPGPEWFEALPQLKRLYTLTIDDSMTLWRDSLFLKSLAQLRAIPSLTRIDDKTISSAYWVRVLPALLADNPSLQLRELNLDHETCDDALRLALLPLAGSLTSLRPKEWTLADCAWLADFSELKHLGIVTKDQRYHYRVIGDPNFLDPASVSLLEMSLLATIPRLLNLTWLLIDVPTLSLDQLSQMVQSLPPLLDTLSVKSQTINSLGWLAAAPRLHKCLKRLQIKLPAVPREESSHLLSLGALEVLDIAGSFTEPLFAKQLFPFQPPYPSAALHWMRAFIPRGKNEPVPIPPVDLAAKAAAVVDFDTRVRAGQVRAAEFMNSSQLSLVFQFLDMRDFSHTARTCRSWRNAASLPLAWGMANSPDEGRVLNLNSAMVQCVPAILPTLPLWRNARAVHFDIAPVGALRYGFQGYQSGIPQEVVRSFETVSMLLRVESLTTDLRKLLLYTSGEPFVVKFFQSLAPRLLRADLGGVRPAELMRMERLRVLTLRCDANFGAGAELAHLQQLAELTIVTSGEDRNYYGNERRSGKLAPELGDTLLRLSLQHSLRSVSLELENGASTQPDTVAFFASLSDVVDGGVAAAAATAPAAGTEVSSQAGAGIPLAAVLTSISVANQDGWSLLPLRHILRLPKLRHLGIRSTSAKDFEELDSIVASGHLPPLKSLELAGPAPNPLRWRPVAQSDSLRLPVGCLDRLLCRLPLLESLSLSAQFHSAELASLAQLPVLKALTLTGLDSQSLTLDALAVLPRCTRLRHLTLARNAALPLLSEDWLEAPHAQQPNADSKEDNVEDQSSACAMEVDADEPPAYSDLVAAVSSCPTLLSFSWTPSSYTLEAAFEYTQKNSRRRVRRTNELKEAMKEREKARMRHALRQLGQKRREEISAATPPPDSTSEARGARPASLRVFYCDAPLLLASDDGDPTADSEAGSGAASQQGPGSASADAREMALEFEEEKMAAEIPRVEAEKKKNKPRKKQFG